MKPQELPKSKKLWRYEMQRWSEGGELKWYPSVLLPLKEAQQEAWELQRQGITARVVEDAPAVIEFQRVRETKANEKNGSKR